MFKFENDEVGCGSGKEVDVVWSSGEWKNGKSWSSSSLSVSSSVGSFGGSSSVMEWSSVEENELVVQRGGEWIGGYFWFFVGGLCLEKINTWRVWFSFSSLLVKKVWTKLDIMRVYRRTYMLFKLFLSFWVFLEN